MYAGTVVGYVLFSTPRPVVLIHYYYYAPVWTKIDEATIEAFQLLLQPHFSLSDFPLRYSFTAASTAASAVASSSSFSYLFSQNL